MAVTAETKIHDLLERYPYLKSWLIDRAPEFSKLNNPVLYNTMGRVADLNAAASMADLPVETLLEEIRSQIAQHEIGAEELAGAGGDPHLDADERAKRQEVLKGIIRELHQGAPVEQVKARFDELVRDIDSAEIAQMEQALIAEGMPVEDVQRLCDVHVTVFKESLDTKETTQVAENHPVDAYRRENEVVGEIVNELRCSLEALAPGAETDEAARRDTLAKITADLERLSQIDVHYLRKENQLFPVLEEHGIVGPTKVMWSLDDDIRTRIKADRSHAERGDVATLTRSLPETLTMVEDMVYKEEKILFPTALDSLTSEEWERIAAGDSEIGYAWVEGPAGDAAREAAAAFKPEAGELLLPLTTGALTPQQIDWLLRALPFDVTYVDADDRVRYYSEGERVFPRSPAAIGREVRNCHPPEEPAQGGGDPRRVQGGHEGRRRVLDRDRGSVHPHPVLRDARRRGRLPGMPRGRPGRNARKVAGRPASNRGLVAPNRSVGYTRSTTARFASTTGIRSIALCSSAGLISRIRHWWPPKVSRISASLTRRGPKVPGTRSEKASIA